jgi:hypothetical protein
MGLLLIHRIITFIPTYSSVKYPEFQIVYIILAILMIAMSLQTKLGEKVSVLVDRVIELWEGPSDKKKKTGKNNVKVSQPISGQQINNAAITQSLYTDGTAISSLPMSDGNASSQQLPNYNEMYKQDTTQMVGAATPGMAEGFGEPMAANSVLGGGAFGSAW